MDRERFEALMAEYLDGTLSSPEALELDRTLQESPELAGRAADAAELHRLLEQELRGEAARAEGVSSVMRAVARAARSGGADRTATEVMTRVKGARRAAAAPRVARHRAARVLAALAAAAALVLAAVALWRRPPAYPAPAVSGDVELVRGEHVARGALLRARGEATVSLGGYAEVAMEPGSLLGIEGKENAEQVYLRAGTALCDVERGGRGHGEARSFSVRTDAGTVSVKGTRFIVTILDSEGGTQMKAKRILVEVLLGAVAVSGAWGSVDLAAGEMEILPGGEGQGTAVAEGTIESGKPRYLQKGLKGAWKNKGRIVGVAKDAPPFEVTAVSAGGRFVEAAVEKVKEGSVYEVWLSPGVYSLRVAAKGYKALELDKLEVRAGTDLRIDLEFTPADEAAPAAGDGAKIESGKPKYLAKGRRGAWRDKGRIVGIAKAAPKFEVTVTGADGRSVNAVIEKARRGRSVYEVWLAPGVYTLRVDAKGHDPLVLKGLEVRPGYDLRIDLEFAGR